jgi:hypothetical protein
MTASLDQDLQAMAAVRADVRMDLTPDIEHIVALVGISEPTGTWTGGACPRLGRPLGTDVDLADLGAMHRTGARLMDYCWYAPDTLAEVYRMLLNSAEADERRGWAEHPPPWWHDRLTVVWSHAWNANYKFLTDVVQKPVTDEGGDGYAIATFEHNSSEHGRTRPHVHNLMVRQG